MSETLHINFSKPSEVATLLRGMSKLHGEHVITIKRAGRKRTSAQNRLYHGVFVQALRGHLRAQGKIVSSSVIHEMFKRRFLAIPVVDSNGVLIDESTGSTQDLTTVEFNEYLDHIQVWLHDQFGIEVPTIGEFSGQDKQVTASQVHRPMLPGGTNHG